MWCACVHFHSNVNNAANWVRSCYTALYTLCARVLCLSARNVHNEQHFPFILFFFSYTILLVKRSHSCTLFLKEIKSRKTNNSLCARCWRRHPFAGATKKLELRMRIWNASSPNNLTRHRRARHGTNILSQHRIMPISWAVKISAVFGHPLTYAQRVVSPFNFLFAYAHKICFILRYVFFEIFLCWFSCNARVPPKLRPPRTKLAYIHYMSWKAVACANILLRMQYMLFINGVFDW